MRSVTHVLLASGLAIGAALSVGCSSTPEAEAGAAEPAGSRLLSNQGLRPKRTTRPYETELRTGGSGEGSPRSIPPEEIALPQPAGRGGALVIPVVQERDLDVTLNFKGVPAAEVYREIFEKALGVDYVLAAEVGDKVMSFVLEGRIGREELFRTLDAVSGAYGLALMEQDGVVYVVDAKSAVKMAGGVEVGWERVGGNLTTGTHVLPLQSATASDLAETLRPLLSDRGVMFAPRGTNVLVLVESPANTERLLALVRELDRPFFLGRTLRLYSPTYVTPEELTKGMTDFARAAGARVGGENAQLETVVLPRSRQVLVTSRARELVPLLDAWFQKLDRPVEPDVRTTRIYTAQYVPAAMLSSAITSVFGSLPEDDRPVVTTLTGPETGAGGAAEVGQPRAAAREEERDQGRTAGSASREPRRSGASRLPTGPMPQDERLIISAKDGVYRDVRELIDLLDIPPKQVVLQVVVAEVALTGDVQFGIELFTRQELDDDLSYELRSDANFLTVDPVGSAFIIGKNAFALVEAAQQDGVVRVLNAPSVTATSGRPAALTVGREVPVITQQISGSVDATDPNRISNSIEYRDTGVILTVTPMVNDRGDVTLTIQQEVSDVEEPAAGAAIQSPSFTQRTVETTITARSGDTVIMGGIRTDRDNITENKIPFLGDIPLVGLAFRSKNANRQQTDLVVLVTPTVMIDPGELADATPFFLGSFVNLARIDELLEKPTVDTYDMLLN